MSLAPGDRLSRYEIVGPLGSGGMGEVYRAHDSTLKRDVAIKIIPEAFALDSDRLRRFKLEALATAALNHPNILAIYDVGDYDGGTYVVSELLEGRTLRDTLASGALPLRKTVNYAAQIATGLAAAHEKGIVHRDLKPANLFITRDDRVKILDFGLARMGGAAESGDLVNSGTTNTATEPGAVLGTAGYMAPEQVRGERVDHRADLFSFGVVLYEMLTGRRAFHRDSVPGTLAAILDSEPPAWSGDGSVLSFRLIRLMNRCLVKAPRARFESARDLSLLLSDEISDPAGIALSPALASPRHRSVRSAAFVLSAVAFAALGALGRSWFGGPRSTGLSASVAFALALPPGDSWDTDRPVAITNDGARIVYAAVHEGVRRLYVREIAAVLAEPLPGTEGGMMPFFSPDGRTVGFFADAKLKTVALSGGDPRVVCATLVDPRGGSWGADNRIVFAPGTNGGVLQDNRIVFAQRTGAGLFRVASSGGTPEPLTAFQGEEFTHRWPEVLPGGGVVFGIGLGPVAKTRLGFLAPGAGTHVTLPVDGSGPRYLRSGHLVFVNANRGLVAAPFDAAGGSIGEVVPMSERASPGASLGTYQYAVAANGSLVYLPFKERLRALAVVDRRGEVRPLDAPPRSYQTPRLSRDGRQVALTIGETETDVWVWNIESATLTRVTTGGGSLGAIWGPGDGTLTLSSGGSGGWEVVKKGVDVNGPKAAPVTPSQRGGGEIGPVWWSRDGRTLVTNYWSNEGQQWNVGIRTGDGQPRPLRNNGSNEIAGGVSPDGRWLAFTSDETGAVEAYVADFPAGGATTQVSQGGGEQVAWARTGNELVFLKGKKPFVVTMEANGPSKSRPAMAGTLPLASQPAWASRQYDMMPDGSFLIVTDAAQSNAAPPMVVILNWSSTIGLGASAK